MICRRGVAGAALVSLVSLVSLESTVALCVAACSSDDKTAAMGGSPEGAPEAAVAVPEGGTDAGLEASAPGCEGACKTTSLVVDIGGTKRPLDRAQLGTQQGASGAQLHVEAHSGGKPECPSAGSPTPSYTLIVSSIPRAAPGGTASESDGVTSAFFDFKGDLGLPPLTKATSVRVTALVQDPATPPAWSAFDVTATFKEGTVTGHVHAEYCASLSE